MDTMTIGPIACWVMFAATLGVACIGVFAPPSDAGWATDTTMVLAAIVVMALVVIVGAVNVTPTRINNVNNTQGQTK